MCSRFENTAPLEEIKHRFKISENLKLGDNSIKLTKGEIRPTDSTIVIIDYDQVNVLSWGLKPKWLNKPLINARAETINKRKTFQPFLKNRCLIPATSYFEWRNDGQNKFKNKITIDTSDVFSFAGLYDELNFIIITCTPNNSIRNIHNRMPVILNRESESHWIDQSIPFKDAEKVLVPYAESKMISKEYKEKERQIDFFK